MKQFIINSISKTPLYPIFEYLRHKKQLIIWKWEGKPAPPPHIVKQKILKNIRDKFGLKILVETGTYYGDMVEAMKKYFDEIYSIELSKELYEKAKKRFNRDKKVNLIYGDSGIELENLIAQLKKPALFWLDGHYSAGVTAKGHKDTPIYEELTHIFNSSQQDNIVLIDDARCFGTDPAYPSIEELKKFIDSKCPDAKIEIENDVIRIISL